MNKLAIILFALALYGNSFSQEYKILIRDSIYWDIGFADHNYICTKFSEVAPLRFFFSGDTLISGHTYAKCFKYVFVPNNPQPWPNCPPFLIDTIINPANLFIREDTLMRKVYRYNVNTGDYLLFDFSLQQGDSIYNPDMPGYQLIDTVYNITTQDNIVRKKFIIDSVGQWPGGYYIEGIGGTHGLFSLPFKFPYSNDGSWSMCIKDFSGSIIMGSRYCFDFITGITKTQNLENAFQIFPNPVKEKMMIYFSDNLQARNFTFELTDLTGKTIFKKLIRNSQAELLMKDIRPGCYLYKLKTKNIIIKTGKLIKQ